jgi:hypothetical protein
MRNMSNVIETLIDTNVTWLRQAAELLEEITCAEYSASPKGWEPHRASGHLRHILEFYECFLDGAASGMIDYDARRRDLSIEKSRAQARMRIELLISRLQTLRGRANIEIRVRMEDAPRDSGEFVMKSSIERELQVLSSHTIHHFALMALTLRGHGVVLDARFGMAPSTLRHLESVRKLASEAA